MQFKAQVMEQKNRKFRLKQIVSGFVITFLCAQPIWAQSLDEFLQASSNEEVAAQVSNNTFDEKIPYEELRRFALVFAAIKNRYVEPVEDEKLVDAAIKGMLDDLDPHTSYLNKEELESLQEAADGQFSGLGIEVSEANNRLKIIAPIDGGPAQKAGLLPGDEIIKVNGKAVKDLPLGDSIKQLRGEPGTKVDLTIKRQDKDKNYDFTITRDIVKVNSVRGEMLQNQMAYVRIAQFQERTVKDLVAQLNQFKKEPKGLVLDLRNDPGGLLNAAVGTVGAFVEPGSLVVYTKAREKIGLRYKVSPSDYSVDGTDPLENLPKWARKVPLVVLINVGSASASEIVAGALQDYERAKVIGNQSFGKGSVQSVMPLDLDTGIKLTIARYYTPKDRSIQATGIKPDIQVTDTAKGDLFAFTREADLEAHLKNESEGEEIKGQEKTTTLDYEKHAFEFGSKDDFQLQQALNYLQGKKVNTGPVAKAKAKKQAQLEKDKKEKAKSKAEKKIEN